MTELDPEVVARLLLQSGLQPGDFDLEETANDLAQRIKLNATLDELLAGRGGAPDARFDARWPD